VQSRNRFGVDPHGTPNVKPICHFPNVGPPGRREIGSIQNCTGSTLGISLMKGSAIAA